MRKLLFVLSLLSLICSQKSIAYDFESDGIYYNIVDAANREVEVTYGNYKHGSRNTLDLKTGVASSTSGCSWDWYYYNLVSVIIPETVSYNGIQWTVTGIGENAFCTFGKNGGERFYVSTNTYLCSITLPNTIEKIGECAFAGCINLESIILPDNLTVLGSYAFCGCTSLKNVELPSNLYQGCYYSFTGCINLEYAIVPNSSALSVGVFKNCKKLTSVFVLGVNGGSSGNDEIIPSHTIVFYPTEDDAKNSNNANAVPMIKRMNEYYMNGDSLVYGTYTPEKILSAEYINNIKTYYPDEEMTVTSSTFYTSGKDVYGFTPQSVSFRGRFNFDLVNLFYGIRINSKKKDIYIGVNNYKITYGDDIPSLTYTIDNSQFAYNEWYHFSLSVNAQKFSKAGEYPIMVSSDNESFYEHYNIVIDGSPTLTINKAPLSVKVEDEFKTYGDENPSNHNFTYTGLKGEEKIPEMNTPLEVTSNANKNSDVGSYDLTISNGDFVNYYVEHYYNGKLNVYKADLVVKPQDGMKTYGDDNPSFKIDYIGLKNQDTEGIAFTTKPTLTTNIEKYGDAGTYKLKASGGESKNYDLTYQDGTFTINKAKLQAKAKNCTRSYGEENPDFEISYTGLLGNDSKSNIDVEPTVSCDATVESNVGVYPITLTGGESKNYDFIYQNGVLTIEQAEQTISWEQVFNECQIGDQIAITATSSSGMELTISSDNEKVAAIYKVGRTYYVDCVSEGTAHIKVQQEGNGNYYPSARMTKTITVTNPSGIEDVRTSQSYDMYDVLGRKVSTASRGINIIRDKSGKTRKVLKK